MLKWIIEVKVDETWISDGFNITKDNIHNLVAEWLPYATGAEIKGKVIAAPDKDKIAKLQGYKNYNEMKKYKEE